LVFKRRDISFLSRYLEFVMNLNEAFRSLEPTPRLICTATVLCLKFQSALMSWVQKHFALKLNLLCPSSTSESWKD